MARLAKKHLQEITGEDGYAQLKDVILGYNFGWLALEAGVCQATLYNWCDGTTNHPRFTTLMKVAKVLGYTLILSRVGKPSTKLKLVPK